MTDASTSTRGLPEAKVWVPVVTFVVGFVSAAFVVTQLSDQRNWVEYEACVRSAHETGVWRQTPAEWDATAAHPGMQLVFDEVNRWCEQWRPNAPGPVMPDTILQQTNP